MEVRVDVACAVAWSFRNSWPRARAQQLKRRGAEKDAFPILSCCQRRVAVPLPRRVLDLCETAEEAERNLQWAGREFTPPSSAALAPFGDDEDVVVVVEDKEFGHGILTQLTNFRRMVQIRVAMRKS